MAPNHGQDAPQGRDGPPPANEPDYFEVSRQPLQSLVFLLPLIVAYELGVWWFAVDAATGQPMHIVARTWLRDVFEALGVTGTYLPGAILIVVLGVLHLTATEKASPRLSALPGMWVEAVLLALPLMAMMLMMTRHSTPPQLQALQAAAGPVTELPWNTALVMSIGAGLYEELLFRLIALALLHMLLVDVFGMHKAGGAAVAVAVSALAFALYHFPVGTPIDVTRFAFYTAAGVYLAVVYLWRGFGLVAGAHAMYDVLVAIIVHSQ